MARNSEASEQNRVLSRTKSSMTLAVGCGSLTVLGALIWFEPQWFGLSTGLGSTIGSSLAIVSVACLAICLVDIIHSIRTANPTRVVTVLDTEALLASVASVAVPINSEVGSRISVGSIAGKVDRSPSEIALNAKDAKLHPSQEQKQLLLNIENLPTPRFAVRTPSPSDSPIKLRTFEPPSSDRNSPRPKEDSSSPVDPNPFKR
ncbi:MAG: hypothetical protein QM752_00985 [Gammaproteobacteria bacterium]